MNNDMMLTYVIIAVAAYLIGNINPAILIGKLHGIDIRKEGSGNAGMTNTMRVLGFDAGMTVLFCDVLKGFIPVAVAYDYGSTGSMVAFAAVVLGHCFPVFFGFKGGKGVATSLGAALALNWLSAFAALLVAIVLFALTRRMSVGSLGAAISYPFLIYYYEPDYLYFAIGAAVFLLVMHSANLVRLVKGEEKPLTLGGKNKNSEEAEATEEIEASEETEEEPPEELPEETMDTEPEEVSDIENTAESEIAEASAGSEAAEKSVETVTGNKEKKRSLFSSFKKAEKKAVKAVKKSEKKAASVIKTGAALTEEELSRFRLRSFDYEDLESGESHIAAEATKSASLVEAQKQEAIRPEPEPVDYYADVLIPALGQDEKRIAVIGSGSFGTAMANLLTYSGHSVVLYGRNKEALKAMEETRMNERYLPYVILSSRIDYTSDMKEAVNGADIVVFAVPAQKFREVSESASKFISKGTIVVNLAKGIELGSLKRMSEIAAETLPEARYVALSGPSHAEEIVRNNPASVVVASEDRAAADEVQEVFMSENFRVYTQEDLIGVEIAGSVKNVIAITTGISDGMKLGSNARAALMTRAIHEIKRLGVALGADPETFSGLSGIGDIIVTCSTNHSRNRRCGLLIGLGMTAEEAVEKVGSVVEGYYTSDAVFDLARELDVDMPICRATRSVLKGKLDPEKAVRMLMSREKKDEIQ